MNEPDAPRPFLADETAPVTSSCLGSYSGERQVITRLIVERYRPGTDSLRTPADAVDRIHDLASTSTYAHIAVQLNAEGWRTAHGRAFTSQHVAYICRRDGVARGTDHTRLRPKEDAEKIH